MHASATVIVLPPALYGRGTPTYASGSIVPAFDTLRGTIYRVLGSDLPMVLVAPRLIIEQAKGILKPECLLDMPIEVHDTSTLVARSVATAVLASSQSAGWLILPGDMPMLETATLRRIAEAVQTYPMAYPQYRSRRGHPMGFGRELFSELIHLDLNRDLYRLMSRYPAEGIEVNDPGVLIGTPTGPQDSVAQLVGQTPLMARDLRSGR